MNVAGIQTILMSGVKIADRQLEDVAKRYRVITAASDRAGV
jgi:hypothetical protein